MQLFENTFKGHQNIIGTFETSSDNLSQSILGLAGQMGMMNPTTTINANSKAIIVKRSGKKYRIILAMFNPPVILNWTAPFDIDSLAKVINDIATQNKKIGYLNTITLNNSKLIQLAIG